MNDIPNNGRGANIPQQPQKIEQVKSELAHDFEANAEDSVAQKSQELPNVDTAGRSLVFTGDNIENDLKILQENPKAAAAAMEYFEQAYQQYVKAGHENPYEAAATSQGSFINEFVK